VQALHAAQPLADSPSDAEPHATALRQTLRAAVAAALVAAFRAPVQTAVEEAFDATGGDSFCAAKRATLVSTESAAPEDSNE
jgi:hypothetical protein